MQLILQEILQSHPFQISRNFETQDCQCYGVKRIKINFPDKGNSGTRFGESFYYLSSCSHFYNETDLVQYLFEYTVNLE